MSEYAVLRLGPFKTELVDYSPLALRVIDEATSAPDPNAYFSRAYRRGYIDGMFHLLDKEDRFPSGLLKSVLDALDENGIKWSIEDSSKNAEFIGRPVELSVPDKIELRDYQEDAVKKALEEGRGILSVPVNGGKSYLAVSLVDSYKVPSVILVARSEGLKQMHSLFVSCFGEDMVATDVDQAKPIVLMTYSTATKRDLSPYELLVADEVHRVAADTFFKAAMSCTNAYRRFGLSGTPMGREDGKDIYFVGATGEIIYKIDQQFLVERGYSAEAEIAMIETQGTAALSSKSWHDIESAALVEWDWRNHTICEISKEAVNRGKQTLIMVKRIRHGEILQEEFAELGMDVPFTYGSLDGSKRMRYYEDFKSRDCLCMIASGIYDDSVDVPDIEVLINAAGGKSSIATKQKLGRGLRNPGDKSLLMVDFWDRHHTILLRHSKKRKKNYESEGFKVFKTKGSKDLFD